MPETTYVIAAGGTAGHVVPALAVAAELRADGARVVFVGGQRAERELVPQAGFELRQLDVEGLSRTNPLKAARALLKAVGASRVAGHLLDELRPEAVMGGGGYVAGPVGVAAVRQRIPLVLTEADSHLGLSNRLLARRAHRVCLAFPLGGREGEPYLVTGRPVPPPATDLARARERFGISASETVVVVFGGSLGARTLNQAAVKAFGAQDPGFRVLHAAGERDLDELRALPVGAHYDLRGYIDDFAQVIAAADLVVARSGGSIFEIAAASKPAILVPYPRAAGDHQASNARWMEQAGAAIVVPDSELSAQRLAGEVTRLLGDHERLGAMARASAGLARPDAARVIADEIVRAGKASPSAAPG